MKIVLDTNVVVSAMLWKGSTAEIFVLAKRGKVKLCVTDEIVEELERVLEYPKFAQHLALIGATARRITDEFLEVATYYPILHSAAVLISDDPSDDKFLLCALAARASYIVSGDKHLLQLKEFHGITIVTPSQFLKKHR